MRAENVQRIAMSKPTYPATIDTLGKLIDHSMGAFVQCPTCLRAGRPDVRVWASPLGVEG
jgi:hypothetical protein